MLKLSGVDMLEQNEWERDSLLGGTNGADGITWVVIRVVRPTRTPFVGACVHKDERGPTDYFPPESLVRDLERGRVVDAGIRKLVMAVYGTLALALMAVFFKVVEFAGILHLGLLVGLLGALGVFTGALAYERLARLALAAEHPA